MNEGNEQTTNNKMYMFWYNFCTFVDSIRGKNGDWTDLMWPMCIIFILFYFVRKSSDKIAFIHRWKHIILLQNFRGNFK